VQAALASLGIGACDLATVVVTHIHLDHAGGVGDIASMFGGAQVVVHEKGARRLADPSRLMASARMVYGDALDVLFGSMKPLSGGARGGGERERDLALAGQAGAARAVGGPVLGSRSSVPAADAGRVPTGSRLSRPSGPLRWLLLRVCLLGLRLLFGLAAGIVLVVFQADEDVVIVVFLVVVFLVVEVGVGRGGGVELVVFVVFQVGDGDPVQLVQAGQGVGLLVLVGLEDDEDDPGGEAEEQPETEQADPEK
jgi:hypothetical protein